MFDWKPEYAVGISEIDRQHQELFRMANEIYDRVLDVQNDTEMGAVMELLDALGAYAGDHFSLEESLLMRYDYPQLAEHQLEHEGFRAQLAEMLEGQLSQKQVITELIKFITQWIFKHICSADMAYAPYLKAQLH